MEYFTESLSNRTGDDRRPADDDERGPPRDRDRYGGRDYDRDRRDHGRDRYGRDGDRDRDRYIPRDRDRDDRSYGGRGGYDRPSDRERVSCLICSSLLL